MKRKGRGREGREAWAASQGERVSEQEVDSGISAWIRAGHRVNETRSGLL